MSAAEPRSKRAEKQAAKGSKEKQA